jgi:hypothetical protein
MDRPITEAGLLTSSIGQGNHRKQASQVEDYSLMPWRPCNVQIAGDVGPGSTNSFEQLGKIGGMLVQRRGLRRQECGALATTTSPNTTARLENRPSRTSDRWLSSCPNSGRSYEPRIRPQVAPCCDDSEELSIAPARKITFGFSLALRNSPPESVP